MIDISTYVDAALTIAGAALAWCFRQESALVRLKTLAEIADRHVAHHAVKVTDHEGRIASIEQAHLLLAQAHNVQQAQNQQIIDRLGVLSEVKVAIDNLASRQQELNAQVVPRPEVSTMRDALLARIEKLEDRHDG
jgi:hypothetical protein